MSCFCSAQLGSLLGSLALIPPTVGLVPPISLNLIAAANASLGLDAALSAAVNASVDASLMANLSAMASLSTALQGTLGQNLSAALSASAMASTQARLAATLNAFNANAGPLALQAGSMGKLLLDLSGLANLAGLVLAIKAAFGIDLRASGAFAALQARLAASARMNATASVRASVQVSAVASLMAALGFQANAHGALAVNATAGALAGMMAGLPSMGAGFQPLSVLAALMAMLGAIRLALGVDLRTPTAAFDLRVALSMLPLAALAQLSAAMSANAVTSASAALAASTSASAGANAMTALDLAATAQANLSGVGQLAMLMSPTLQATLGLPAGSCGQPCPLALLKGVPAMPGLSAAAGGSFMAG
jgi:hypothetical protein